MKIAWELRDGALRTNLQQAAAQLGAELYELNGAESLPGEATVLLVELQPGIDLAEHRSLARRLGAGLMIACTDLNSCPDPALLGVDEWIGPGTSREEMVLRLRHAARRPRLQPQRATQAADLLRYEELLYDKLTGFPTPPVMIERARELLEREGELTVLYIHFVWYEKIEEIYGWQKLDDVLETTAGAIRRFYDTERSSTESLVMVSHVADDDFILFTRLQAAPEAAERRLRAITERLEQDLRGRIEEEHGEDIAALCGIYVGAATVFRNPKIRTERLIYRGIREAAQAARGAEEWERTRKVADLKSTIRDGAVFIEPIEVPFGGQTLPDYEP